MLSETDKATLADIRGRNERSQQLLTRSTAEIDREELLRLLDQLQAECEGLRRDAATKGYTLCIIRNAVCGECAPLIVPMCDSAARAK